MVKSQLQGIKLVIFDLDGTLIDAYRPISQSFNYTMDKLGYPRLKDLIIRRAVGWGDKNLLKPFVKIKDLNKALFIYRRHHKKSLLKYSKLYPGVYRLMSYLKNKGLLLAVASNRPTPFSMLLIRHFKFNKYFDYVLCADKIRKGKPDPEIIRIIMSKFKVNPFETVYVGDMAIDALAGKRAKVRTIIVTTGSSPKSRIQMEKPYRIIPNILKLLKIL